MGLSLCFCEAYLEVRNAFQRFQCWIAVCALGRELDQTNQGLSVGHSHKGPCFCVPQQLLCMKSLWSWPGWISRIKQADQVAHWQQQHGLRSGELTPGPGNCRALTGCPHFAPAETVPPPDRHPESPLRAHWGVRERGSSSSCAVSKSSGCREDVEGACTPTWP